MEIPESLQIPLIAAGSALVGSLLGGIITIIANWLVQRSEYRKAIDTERTKSAELIAQNLRSARTTNYTEIMTSVDALFAHNKERSDNVEKRAEFARAVRKSWITSSSDSISATASFLRPLVSKPASTTNPELVAMVNALRNEVLPDERPLKPDEIVIV